MFNLLHPSESFISFTSVDGSVHEIWPESGEKYFEGDLLPNGNHFLSFTDILSNNVLKLL